MAKALLDADDILQHASAVVHQHSHEIQPFGHLVRMPIALPESACKESVENRQLLADTMTLRDMYQSITGRCPGRPSISCICCSTSISTNRASWWMQLRNGSSCSAASASPCPTMWRKRRSFRGRPKVANGTSPNFKAASRARNRFERSKGNGAYRCRARRSGHQRFTRQRCDSDQRTAGLVRRRACRRHTDGPSRLTTTAMMCRR